ncbi:ABC transporter permease, partial [Desulfolutivibrio sp.]|uniref:ABC transporter permease n=1 Tax=Desulfolutivibrio sp. TaxID=2773296 RepID=UPI002F967AB9
MKTSRLSLWIFLSPVLMWLFLLIVLPHLDLFIMSFRAKDEYGQMGFSLQNYANFFTEPIYWLTFVRTALYSVITTVFTFLLAMPVAFYIVKVVRPKYKGFLMVLLLLPFWVSELVRVYGWMILLRESGVVNFFLLRLGIVDAPLHMLYTDATMIMGLVYTSMLFMVVPVISVLESLDDSLIEAASDLGGSKIS